MEDAYLTGYGGGKGLERGNEKGQAELGQKGQYAMEFMKH